MPKPHDADHQQSLRLAPTLRRSAFGPPSGVRQFNDVRLIVEFDKGRQGHRIASDSLPRAPEHGFAT
ncbi:hypothetical protein EOS_09550 [Caballeronia mineralivorans PML1(12)]|uniref:Uncharacterized protein n=1 Tax=Caballeronia mineralivorans PML1(12) TaxID=908627 RepID=A0A0J1G2M7_9BURK|nr:hypothetical protein EOS_09550 [Caballeronia mineralivorans PML1(12)]